MDIPGKSEADPITYYALARERLGMYVCGVVRVGVDMVKKKKMEET